VRKDWLTPLVSSYLPAPTPGVHGIQCTIFSRASAGCPFRRWLSWSRRKRTCGWEKEAARLERQVVWDWSVIFLITWDWGGVSECGEWGCEGNVTNGDKNLERAVNPLRRANDVNEEF